MAPSSRPRVPSRAVRGVLTLAFLSALVGTVGSVAAGASDSVATTTVVVQGGSSLWAIAQQVDPAADPRAVIAEIKSLNGLTDAVIHPGQALVVPVR
jgi:LysM repeat protein